MNLKLFYLLFNFSLTVQQADTCRGISALLKFQSQEFLVYPIFQKSYPRVEAFSQRRRSRATKQQLHWGPCRLSFVFYLIIVFYYLVYVFTVNMHFLYLFFNILKFCTYLFIYCIELIHASFTFYVRVYTAKRSFLLTLKWLGFTL